MYQKNATEIFAKDATKIINIKNKKSYNCKIDYLFCKFLFFDHLPNDEKRWRNLYDGKVKPKNKVERNLVLARDILDFIKSERCQIDLASINTVFSMITRKYANAFELLFLNELVKLMETNIEETDLLVLILRNCPFKILNKQLAIVFYNFLRIKRDLFPIIFYPHQLQDIIVCLDLADEEKSRFLIKELVIQTIELNRVHKVLPATKVKERLLQLKEQLIAEFGVLELSIYGSYARGEENQYSDLDVIVKVKEWMGFITKSRILSFLTFHLGLRVDGKVVSDDALYIEKGLEVLSDIQKIF